LGSGLAKAKAHLPEQALALAHTQANLIMLAQMLAKQWTVPQGGLKTKFPWRFAQIRLQPAPLPGIEQARAPRSFSLAQTVQPALFKAPYPALHRSGIFAKQSGHFSARLPSGHQQHPMQAMVVAGFLAATDFLLDGQLHHFRILNLQFAHRHLPRMKTMLLYH
jgi:hypothetical protein